MTASERPVNETRTNGPVAVPGHPGRWRIVSLFAVAAAAIIITVSIVHDRRSTDTEPAGQDALEFTEIRVAGAAATAFGLHASAHSAANSSTGPTSDQDNAWRVPVSALGQSLVTATAPDGALLGMSIHEPTNPPALIDDTSTAQVLLTLSPALFGSDVGRASRSAAVIVDDPMHATLVRSVGSSPGVTPSNDALSTALAGLLDRIPFPEPEPDQGCDSVANPRAFPVAGTCVQPGQSDMTILNEQDRWVLVFGEPENWSMVCGALAPTGSPRASETISADECGDRALLTGAGERPSGPTNLDGVSEAVLTSRHDAATALTLLDDYVLPYAAITAGVHGHNANVVVSSSSVPAIVRELTQLMASDQLALNAVRAAYDPTSTPAARHRATAQAAYSMLSSDQVVAVLPTELGQREEALALLDFYRSTAEFMTADRTGPRWIAASTGVIDGLQ